MGIYFIECKNQTNAAELECLVNSGKKFKATQDDCLVKFDYLPKEIDKNPRTKAVYEKVEFNHAWEAVKSIEVDGIELFRPATDGLNNHWIKVDYVQGAAAYYQDLHKKVDKEIDWKDELIEFLNKEKHNGGTVNGWCMGDNDDEFSTVSIDFDLRDKRFIAMCHLVANLTDKPE